MKPYKPLPDSNRKSPEEGARSGKEKLLRSVRAAAMAAVVTQAIEGAAQTRLPSDIHWPDYITEPRGRPVPVEEPATPTGQAEATPAPEAIQKVVAMALEGYLNPLLQKTLDNQARVFLKEAIAGKVSAIKEEGAKKTVTLESGAILILENDRLVMIGQTAVTVPTWKEVITAFATLEDEWGAAIEHPETNELSEASKWLDDFTINQMPKLIMETRQLRNIPDPTGNAAAFTEFKTRTEQLWNVLLTMEEKNGTPLISFRTTMDEPNDDVFRRIISFDSHGMIRDENGVLLENEPNPQGVTAALQAPGTPAAQRTMPAPVAPPPPPPAVTPQVNAKKEAAAQRAQQFFETLYEHPEEIFKATIGPNSTWGKFAKEAVELMKKNEKSPWVKAFKERIQAAMERGDFKKIPKADSDEIIKWGMRYVRFSDFGLLDSTTVAEGFGLAAKYHIKIPEQNKPEKK